MIETGCALENPAMRSSEAATGTRTTTRACSISTTIGLTTTTTMSASAEPRLSDSALTHLDDCQQASEGSILVESIPQDPAKARQHAKPKTAAAPTGAVVERGREKYPPYRHDVYRTYFAVIKHLKIYDECVEPCPINKGGTRDTEKGAKLHWAIYNALQEPKESL